MDVDKIDSRLNGSAEPLLLLFSWEYSIGGDSDKLITVLLNMHIADEPFFMQGRRDR